MLENANIENVWKKFKNGQVSVSEAEEASRAYKEVDKVVEVIHKLGLASRVARLVPMVVVKG
jgi:RNA-splicing ligase RtcB